MTPVMAPNVIATQARQAAQGDSMLSAFRSLTSGPVRDRAGRDITDAAQRETALRQKVDEFVGLTFYGTLMKMTRNSALKGPYGHGGRGEEVFRAQLDQELAKRAGRASSSSLNEAVYRSLIRNGASGTTNGRGLLGGVSA